jgi:hypothetical protein
MDITRLHRRGAKLRMVTAYSAPMAAAVDASGAEMVLVGDSLGMVELGLATTQPVTLDQVTRRGGGGRLGPRPAERDGALGVAQVRPRESCEERTFPCFYRHAKLCIALGR